MLLRRSRARAGTNPVFYADRLRRFLADEPERLERILSDPSSVDLLTWNVFESFDTDPDRDYLAGVLEPLAGPELAAPLHVSLWTGARREPLLRPSGAYARHVAATFDGHEEARTAFLRPVEAPVRIESPAVVTLVDTALGSVPAGTGGRDRLVELIDAGAEHARALQKPLTITVVYRSGTQTAATLSARMNRLRTDDGLAAALPWRRDLPPVRLLEVSWQQLLARWEHEHDTLRLSGQPTRAFLEHARRLGLR